MHKQRHTFEYLVFDGLAELSEPDRLLMEQAINAREKAYAPYSGFRVGAAVLMENGKVVLGNNQENASFPSGLCAERVAVFQAGSLYPGMPIHAIAISAASVKILVNQPAAPCGNCRQAIAEYEQRQPGPIRILLMGEQGSVYLCKSLNDLLPLAFGPGNLK